MQGFTMVRCIQSAKTLSLPMHPYMDAAEQQQVIDAVLEAL